ncbi:unnamed protein product [Brugia pahangi]|uniref:Transposase n=1 Tax=Brugia pahangi TaxID=6280 RepID=A0A0N4TFR2_BRUPA|nr:unnamed protein product [Brugia pahangi]
MKVDQLITRSINRNRDIGFFKQASIRVPVGLQL